MNKKALLASVLAGTMLLSGCSLIVKDEAVDAATVIIKVGDHEITKDTFNANVNSYLNYMASMYSSNYGYTIDTTNASIVADAREYVANALVESNVVEDKMKELGVYDLSAEEQESIDTTWDSYRSIFSSYTEGKEMTEDEKNAYLDAMISSYFGVTKESMLNDKRTEALKAKVVADVTVTDEQVTETYNKLVEEAKSEYESSPAAYGTDVNGGSTVYYRPAGYRLVKSILVKFTTEDSDKISGLTSKASTEGTNASTALTAAKSMEIDTAALNIPEGTEDAVAYLADMITVTVAAGEEEPTVTTENKLPEGIDATLAENLVKYKEAQAKQNWYTEAAAAAKTAAYANIDAKADEVLARLAAGEDFTAVQYEVTEDPGMKEGATCAANGYAVCNETASSKGGSFEDAFVEGAMALANVGDVSGKIVSGTYGYFIVQYAADVEEGAVAQADVQDTVKEQTLSEAQDAYYEEQVAAWVSAANASIDLKKLD